MRIEVSFYQSIRMRSGVKNSNEAEDYGEEEQFPNQNNRGRVWSFFSLLCLILLSCVKCCYVDFGTLGWLLLKTRFVSSY